ncbi:uncharacterized protein FFNC_14756 [Fusarium fujikuroi]|nr:uncharacterized protein FFNC_14756 [Fusarium fujikuroi]
MEMVYAFTYILGLEEFEEDLEKVDLRLSFLEKSCEHVAKASRARDEIDRSKGSRSQEEPRDGDHDAEESRKERMADLKARLEDLNVGVGGSRSGGLKRGYFLVNQEIDNLKIDKRNISL